MLRYAYQSQHAVNFFNILCVILDIYVDELCLYRLSSRYINESIFSLVFYKWRTHAKYRIEILVV